MPFLYRHRTLVIIIFALILTSIAMLNKISNYEMAKSYSEASLVSVGKDIAIDTIGYDFSKSGAAKELYEKYRNSGVQALKIETNNYSASAGSLGETPNRIVYEKYLKTSAGKIHLTVYFEEDSGDHIIYKSSKTIIISVFIILFLWVLAFFFFSFSNKIDKLEKENLKKEHLAAIGEMGAVLAHEIRSPLSAIKGFAQYILKRNDNSPETAEDLEVIITESKRLEKLVNDLLLFAGTTNVNSEEFSLNTLINEIWEMLTCETTAPKFSLDTNLKSDTVYSDRMKFRHIIFNVLQNSLEALGENGEIRILLSEEGAILLIEVSDNGCGMDVAELEKARLPFQTTKAKGTGLGLSIVDKNLQILKGSMTIFSKISEGTKVVLRIPRNHHGE